MKKIVILVLAIMSIQFNSVGFAKNVDRYELMEQIQTQKFSYSVAGLFTTVRKNGIETARFSLETGVDANATFTKMPLVFFAMWYKQPEMFKLLLDYQANPNTIYCKISILDFAIMRKQTEIAEMLLNAGAKPDLYTYSLVKKSKDKHLKELIH